MMDDKLLIALVAAGSAFLGSVIPTLFNFLNNKEQRQFEIKKLLLEKQKAAYFELLSALQAIINEQTSEDRFRALQVAGNQVAIYGDKNASQEYLSYYYAMVSQGQGMRPSLTSDDHKKHQTNIMNAVRKGMGLDAIESFEIIGFHPPSSHNNAFNSDAGKPGAG
jgi:hypothetical protein